MQDNVSFGPFVFDASSAILLRDGKSIGLGSRGAALLRSLVEANGSVVGKDALIEVAWPGVAIEEGNLTVQIAALRKALGPRPDGVEWIVTVPRVGYRLHRSDAVAAGSTAAILPSLALLPFQNLSGDPEQEYFVDGIVDDLISALSRFKSFAVIARNSSFVYKGRAVDVREVARDLGVRYVLEGSVRRSGGRLRVAAQLVDGPGGTHLWAQTFDGSVAEIFDFQDEITERIVAFVEPEIQRAEIERSRRERPGSIAAYDLYLRALPHFLTATLAENDEAYACLSGALEIEPDNPTYLAAISRVMLARGIMVWPPLGPDDRSVNAAYVERALARGSNDATVIASCADTLAQGLNEYGRGLELARHAVEANPHNPIAVNIAGVVNLHCGDLAESLRHFHRALLLNPRDPAAAWTMAGIAHAHLVQGDDEEALKWAEKAHAINAQYEPAYWMLIAASAHLGRREDAQSYLARMRARSPHVTVASIVAGQAQKDPSRFARIAEGLRLAGLPDR